MALVTGASRGIGRGIAIGLGEVGATVHINGRSMELNAGSDPIGRSLEHTRQAVEQAGGRCIAVAVDHRDNDQVQDLFGRIEREHQGRLDVPVNNADEGVRALWENQGKPFWEGDPGIWDTCDNVGLRRHYVATIHGAPLMTARQGA